MPTLAADIRTPVAEATGGDKGSEIPSDLFSESVHLTGTSFKVRVSPSAGGRSSSSSSSSSYAYSSFTNAETFAGTSLYLMDTWTDVWVSISLYRSKRGSAAAAFLLSAQTGQRESTVALTPSSATMSLINIFKRTFSRILSCRRCSVVWRT